MLKKLIVKLIIISVAVWTIFYLIPGMIFLGGVLAFAEIVGIFFVLDLFVKPLAKLIPLPFKLLDLGIVNIVIDAFTFWALSNWLNVLKITPFWFSGLGTSKFVIAPIEIPYLGTLIIAAVLMGMVNTTLTWLTK